MQELRFAELRTEPGTRNLSGIAVQYGDIARMPWDSERIEAGAFQSIGDILLNRQHDRGRPLARTGGGGLTLTDGSDVLRMSATLPETRDAKYVLALVRSGVMRGLSTEFVAEDESFKGSLRIIKRAKLVGLAVVDQGAYPASLVSQREQALRTGMTRRRVILVNIRIPFLRKSEARSAPSGIDYTEALANALVERATGTEGTRADADLTAAVEAASGIVARALSMGSINPANERTMALNAPTMALIGRDLIRSGECLFMLNVAQNGIQALPCSHWDVQSPYPDRLYGGIVPIFLRRTERKRKLCEPPKCCISNGHVRL